jgi:hypothetical protein
MVALFWNLVFGSVIMLALVAFICMAVAVIDDAIKWARRR